MLFENHPVRFGIVQGGFVFWLRHAGLGRPYRARYVGGAGVPRAMPWADVVCPFGAWRDRFGEPMLFILLVQP